VFGVGLLIVFLAIVSLEFPAEIFLASYARETLIKNGMPEGLRSMKGYIPWV
jgi:hypothetical protein